VKAKLGVPTREEKVEPVANAKAAAAADKK